jgi:hypothetical protein
MILPRYSILGVVLVCIAVIAVATPCSASGTELYLKTTASAFAPGSDLVVGIFVNANEPVNAFDIEIGYSPATLEFETFDTSDSIIGVWKGTPEVLSDGIIRIQGGIIKPFEGRAGEIIKLTFRVRPEVRFPDVQAAETLQWSFRRANAYAADGKGTAVPLSVTPLVLPVVSSLTPARLVESTDTIPPVFSVVRIAESPVDDAHFAIWDARDDSSGIVGSRIRTKQWLTWGQWETAVNPVRLPRGTWAVEIRITDGQGNSAEARAYLWPTFAWKMAALIFCIVLLSVVVFTVRRTRRRA